MENFKQECEEWLSPLGYSIHYHSNDGNSITFWNTDRILDGKASCNITCTNDLGKKSCRITGSLGKLTLYLDSGEIAFKHRDIQVWIDKANQYLRACAYSDQMQEARINPVQRNG